MDAPVPGLSRLCVPFTPFRGRLGEAVVCLVSTAGVRPADAQPFAEEDLGWREVPSELPASSLHLDHPRFDRAPADRDRNAVFPADRLRELAAAGSIGGLTARHFATSFTPALRAFAERTAPALARAVAAERPQAVLLTGGCRVCHRAAAALQRAIESLGIPTVVLTGEPEETEGARVSRALHAGFPAGSPAGPPGDVALQTRAVAAALALLVGPARPGEVVAWDPSAGGR